MEFLLVIVSSLGLYSVFVLVNIVVDKFSGEKMTWEEFTERRKKDLICPPPPIKRKRRIKRKSLKRVSRERGINIIWHKHFDGKI